ncbi:lytic transglycosylase domain-containing protein [Azospirillum sp. TSO22-1]|uniref:lytic transglycosylase domain-containing protein n=1 Tax=Azospirillum sp. TSO22-1 TaxID=716789 RepID=UPI000D64BB7E|nr:lytic transglycosylase domain-containing protein [Azospirillum sp. TSO22-1]
MRFLRALPVLLLVLATVPFAAARAGAPSVENGVAVVRGPGTSAVPANPPAVLKRECEAAESGDAEAAYRMARRFLFGLGVERDRRVGAAWLRAAASRGHAEARKLVAYVPGEVGRIRPWCRPGGAPPRGVAAPPEEIVRMVRAMAPTYGLDPDLVLAVVRVESAFRTNAVSPKEAAGLMQLIPETAERFAVRDVFDPQENLRGGMKYLRWLLAYFSGDVTLALAGYNAGEGAVDKHRGVPPYEETRSYVQLIRRLYARDNHPFDPAAADPSPVIARRTATLPR